ncbi:HD domain-containing protein [Paracoccus aminovorans]|uniref:HD domain-containing protein n=1 Tax=Paracoccus aminovorans TaxID=34004 RepID=UPI0012E32FF4|nr:HD domain-containing protein [Paracoccus aminovorans]MDQ7774422.1 HD domain-containing protein [Paracoccus aminovorans]
MREPWGKPDLPTGGSHHLIYHSADVAAVVHELLLLPSFRSRLEAAAGVRVDDDGIACLAALAFLHDVGKLAPPFRPRAGRPAMASRRAITCAADGAG